VQLDGNSLLFISLLGVFIIAGLFGTFYVSRLKALKNAHRALELQLNEQAQAAQKDQTRFEQLSEDIVTLSQIGNEISATLDFDLILKILYTRVNQLMDASIFLIGLYDKGAKSIDFKLTIEDGVHQPQFIMPMKETERPAVWCIENNKPLIFGDYEDEHARYFGELAIPKPKSGKIPSSLIYWPLIVGGHIVGVLSVQSHRKNAYSRHHQDMIGYLAATTAIALDNASAYLALEQQKVALEKANEHVRGISSIGQQVNASLNLDEILLKLYNNINTLMDAPIFGIALYDEENQSINVKMNVEYGVRFGPYTRDMNDKSRFSVWCIDHCKAIFINNLDEQGHDFIQNHEYEQGRWLPQGFEDEFESKLPQSLIYIPLTIKHKVIGLLSVQNCKKYAFEPVHLDILTSLGGYTATAIENARMFEDLLAAQEHLQTANQHLSVVSEIGKQVNASLNLDDVLLKIYDSVYPLMDAPLFGVGLYVAEKNELEIQIAVQNGVRCERYSRDMNDKSQFPVWCVDNQQIIYINDLDTEGNLYIEKHEYEDVNKLNDTSLEGLFFEIPKSLIYIPLMIKSKVIGVISVQSFNKEAFEPEDVEILTSLAGYAATAIENARMYQSLLETQKQLVEAEKMASLGALVAGVAHEMNTPIGICLTASTALEYQIDKLLTAKADKKLTKKEFEVFECHAEDGLRLLIYNLHRIGDLVSSFKNIAVDQSCDSLSCFTVHTLFTDVTRSLQSKLNDANVELILDCDHGWKITTYAGALSQVLIAIIINSIEHGFESLSSGMIQIHVTRKADCFIVNYKDNGKGLERSLSERIFEPFFTTKRGKGYIGLGMHVVFNIVSQQLGGSIDCRSDTGKGFELTFRLAALQTDGSSRIS
jgi:K+-sensing histidine kinase KdpD